MNISEKLNELLLLRETSDLECKKAAGADGKGELPKDFWKTYSAMANTDGGTVLLGVEEKQDRFFLHGIEKIDKVTKELFDTANNPGKVSVNLLANASVQTVEMEGKTILRVMIPRASRQQRPVYLNGNPLGNTYVRLHEGDATLANDDVKRMLAEQREDSRDTRILKGFDIEDLNSESLRAYRQIFANRQPEHPWNELEPRTFLHSIGAWRKDRESGESGVTAAGLLMFGNHPAIQEAFPLYMLDYQERAEARSDKRWIDRVTLDGTWSGNLYDFYRKVYVKLTDELKVPFELEGDRRKDETPAHVAIREALCNVLVHADYEGRCSVLIVKRPDLFGFRNPGLMRVPVEVALQGGHPDCRNRTLHQMFRYVGIGDQAGSGLPKILNGWHRYHWRPPVLEEKREPYDQTLLTMRMIDLFPPELVDRMRERFGAVYDTLPHLERVALAIAAVEGTVTHQRLCALGNDHPADATHRLRHLVEGGFLEQTGSSRGAVYHLKGMAIPGPEDVFGSPNMDPDSPNLDPSSPNLGASSPNLGVSSPNLARNADGLIVTDTHALPFADDISQLAPPYRLHLETIAAEPRKKKKIPQETMTRILEELCTGHFITISCLAALVQRDSETLRGQYLAKMVRSGSLEIAFPRTPNDPRQAYTRSRESSKQVS